MGGFLFCEYSNLKDKQADFTSSLIFCGMISSSLILCGQLHSRANCIQWELENKKSDARMYLVFAKQHKIKRNAKRIQEKTNEIRPRRIILVPSSLKSGQWDS